MTQRLVLVLILVEFCIPQSLFAHPDLIERIDRLTAAIDKQPQDPALHLQRGEIFRLHAQFQEALADIEAADRLKADGGMVLLAKARVFSDAGQMTNAFAALERLLAAEPENPEGMLLRARCRIRNGQTNAAIEDLTFVVGKLKTPEPDLFLERAHAQASIGRLENAVSGLDEGMARIGAVPQLQLAAINYERARRNYAGALMRLDKFIARHSVKEPWLVWQGEILEQANRLAEARETFGKVIAGIEAYPAARRSLEMTKQIEARAREGIARVESKLPGRDHQGVPLVLFDNQP